MPRGAQQLDSAEVKRRTSWESFWSSGPLLRRVLSLFYPFWRGTVAIVVIDITLALVNVAHPIYHRYLVDTIWPTYGGTAYLQYTAVFKLLTLVVEQVLKAGKRYVSVVYVSEPLKTSMRTTLYNHYQKFSLNFFIHTKYDEMSTRLWVGGMDKIVIDTLTPALRSVIKLVILVGVMIKFDARLLLLSLCALPLYLGPTRRFASEAKAASKYLVGIQREIGMAAHESLSVAGVTSAKLFGTEEKARERFAEGTIKLSEWSRSVTYTYQKTKWWQTAVSTLATCALYWYGSILLERKELTVGMAIGAVTFTQRLFAPLNFLTALRVNMMEALIAFESYFEGLDLVPDQKPDAPNAQPLRITDGRIEVTGLTFRYRAPPSFPKPVVPTAPLGASRRGAKTVAVTILNRTLTRQPVVVAATIVKPLPPLLRRPRPARSDPAVQRPAQ